MEADQKVVGRRLVDTWTKRWLSRSSSGKMQMERLGWEVGLWLVPCSQTLPLPGQFLTSLAPPEARLPLLCLHSTFPTCPLWPDQEWPGGGQCREEQAAPATC